MSAEQNKAISRRVPTEVFSQGRLEVIDEIFAPDFTEHMTRPPGIPAGREGIRAIASAVRKGFPDITYRVDFQVAEGDFVAGYVTASGTNTGELLEIPATGKHAEWTESHLVKIVNGKITEHWGVIDQLARLRQLGLAATPEAAPVGR